MLPKIWSLLLLGSVIYPFLSAKFCSRSYINGKWITEGDCGGAESMSQIMKELQLKAGHEKKWTVFQRRKYGNVSFFRGWDDYAIGFGDPKGDFWLGLETIHQMTKNGNMEMKMKMITRDGIYWVAKYSSFRIGPGSGNYTLHVSGYSGNVTEDAFSWQNNHQFSTHDADNDYWASGNCASRFGAGWWYDACAHSNLNGDFYRRGEKGIWWRYRSKKLRFSEMKLR